MTSRSLSSLVVVFSLALTACKGADGVDGATGATGATGAAGANGADGSNGINGADGANGTNGTNGTDGADGSNGSNGTNGTNGLGVRIPDFHGTDYMQSTGEYADGAKFLADLQVTGATAAEDGTVTVTFTVADSDGNPYTGLTSASANIAALHPGTTEVASSYWESYSWQEADVTTDGDWPEPIGTAADQAYKESDGTLTDNGDGSYSYLYSTNLSDVTMPVSGTAITYDRTLTHRACIMIGGHSGATGTDCLDFVPDGSAVTTTRNIVSTDACVECHGVDFHGHGGDRRTVDNCVTCHQVDTWDPNSGNTVDMKVMIHKIHAGGELASIPGADGILYDDPNTTTDESADNGEYAIWGYRNSKAEWSDVGFPAIIENCTKCHTGSGEQVDNWKTVPNRAVCGSCHDTVDFATGANHPGGVQTTDGSCTVCHSASNIETYHAWYAKNDQDTPEFDLGLTVSTPSNGSYFVPGEQPVVTMQLTDKATGVLLDHRTIVQDTDGAEGCQAGETCTRDGMFNHFYLMVAGPRDNRNPVLTTAAEIGVTSDGVGPFNMNSLDSLSMVFDGGMDIKSRTDTLSANVTVAVDTSYFANPSQATPTELANWLNDDDTFYARGWATVTDAGELKIIDRNLGNQWSVALESGDVTDEVFAGDTSAHTTNSSYPSNNLILHTDPTTDDPKAEWDADGVRYTLNPVDDLQAGTYVASVEIADAGRISDTDYWTPTVGTVSFQVGQADEELPIAANCSTCHQNHDGDGFVLDYARHNKAFSDNAIDQCGGCHDYQNRYATGDWSGANPISRRVHAVHNGANLNYPEATVGHSDGDAGRYWNIAYPQDIRYCEACHDADTTSGSWETSPNRLACSGCHDSDSATAHIKLQTWDPTPDDPYSGDEEESCGVCH